MKATETSQPMFENWPMKPMMILPVGAMDDENIRLLRENHICVVVAENPAALKFVDPLPTASSRTEIENAAIKFSRRVLRKNEFNDNDVFRGTLTKMFVDMLVSGTPLDPNGTTEEQERRIIDAARRDELERIGREEVREERAAKKAAKAKKA